MDWLARSPPSREPACPDAGASVLAFADKRDQVQVAAPVERQFGDALVLDDGAESRVLGLQEVGRGRYLDRFADLSDLQRDVEPYRLLHLDLDVAAGDGFETGMLGFEFVESGSERREGVVAGLRTDGAADALVLMLVSVTAAPATAAPLGSLTRPVNSPNV